ncbi:MAG: bacteriorhodopsin [Halobacteriaceae archaeon]
MVPPGEEAAWLWVGTAGMLAGTAYFAAKWWAADTARTRGFYLVTVAIPALAFASYLSMALGYGVVEVVTGGGRRVVYWARYAEWLFTTPLLLVDLALVAGARRSTVGTLVGLDAAMIAAGLAATLNTEAVLGLDVGGVRLVWWGVSTGFFLVLLYYLFGTLSAQARDAPADARRLFRTLRNLTAGLWVAYPVVWLVGTEGLGYLGLYWETAAFVALDLAAKVGFGAVLLRSHAALESAVAARSGGVPAD